MRRRAKDEARSRGWTRWTEDEARAVLAEHRQSGLSAAAFARRSGFLVTRLAYWQKRLGDSQSTSVQFVSVPLTASSGARSSIEIEHEGVIVRVREDLDVAHVARLVRALARAAQPC